MKLKISAIDRVWPISVKNTFSKNRRASSHRNNRRDRRTLSLTATLVAFIALLIGAAHSGVTHADTLPVVNESGDISSDETWVAGNVYYVESTVTVDSGVTLTINPGAIVKFATGFGYNFIYVDSGGTLNAAGTSTNPVIFTSAEDDSQGGDTTGDGATSGSSGDYRSAIYPYGGTVDISYADFEYGTQDIGDYPGNNNGSTVTVTDSTFSNSVEGVVQNSDSSLTLQRNSFASSNTSYPVSITSMDVSGIDLYGTNANTFSGSGENIAIDVEGYSSVASGNTWSVGSGPVVYIGGQPLSVSGTVNLYAGTIVKTNRSRVGFDVYSGGSLNANGTSSSPVSFTSYEDDSIGGDTTGDGSSSGSPGDYYGAIAPQGGDTYITYANFNYASDAIYDYPSNDSGSNVTVTNSTFTDDQEGVVQNSDSSLTLQSNSFVDNTNYPISVNSVDVSGIALSGSNANTFTGTGSGIVVEVKGYSSVGSGETWTIGSGPVVLIDGQPIDVTGEVDLGAGAIIKMSHSHTGFDVYSGATLDASGSSGNPVVFTSYEDDSIGGDTTGDGVTSGSPGDYTAVVDPVGGTVNISFADLDYASAALYDSAYPDNSGSSVTVTNSSFSNNTQGVVQKNDSSLTLQSNSFVDNTSFPIFIYSIDPSGIALSGADTNTFSGSGDGLAVYVQGSTSVGSGETWTVGDDQELYLDNGINVSGTVDLGAGVIVKINGSNIGFNVESGGALNATGTTSSPIIITSVNDNSVGGSTGSGSPAAGDYSTAFGLSGGTASVSNANIEYANTAINMTSGSANFENTTTNYNVYAISDTDGTIIYRGTITNSTSGIYACNWQFSCNVDAAYVNWGSASGPFPGSSTLACGSVTVNPWTYGGTNYTNHNIFAIPACDSSETPSEQMNDRISSYQVEKSTLTTDCSNSVAGACNYINTYDTCIQAAWNVVSSNEGGSFSMPSGSPITDPTGYVSAFLTSLSDYIESQEVGSVLGTTSGIAGEVVSQVGIIANLNGAYDSCLSAAHASGY